MSWVQQSAAPLQPPPQNQLQQHQLQQQKLQQQQQQQQTLMQQQYAGAPPTSVPGGYFGNNPASNTANANLSSDSMRPQMHVANNATITPFMASQPSQSQPQATAPLSLHQQTQQQQHAQGYFNNQQQQPQSQHWQQQQENYMQPNNMLQSNVVNNWQQQTNQQQQQQPLPPPQQHQPQQQQNVVNANMFPQQVSNNWQQPDLQATTNYGNYYAQSAQLSQQVPQQQQQQQQHQNFAQPSDASQYYQQPLKQQQQSNVAPTDFFDNNSINKNDTWGDWDWNDNHNNNNTNDLPQAQSEVQPPAIPEVSHQEHQQLYTNNNNDHNVIEDSFSNENWSWNIGDDGGANVTETMATTATLSTTSQVPMAKDQQQASNILQVPQQQTQQQSQSYLQSTSQHVEQPQVMGDFSLVTSKKADSLKADVATKPTSLPILPDAPNENFNSANTGGQPNNNIPNSVYMSQAKPVSRPSRQYASPPGGATPSDAPENALTPPQAFQNEPAKVEALTSAPPPPPPSMTPPSSMPPPGGATGSNAGTANPFKRAGVAQHHRAGLMPTTKPTHVPVASMATPTNLIMPPPPADFANVLSVTNLEPDNLEILHENQEVISSATSLSQAAVPQNITLPSGNPVLPTGVSLPPPNDERNQYLQTSHLSENPDEELNVEGDNNLPPPGLSRLVLGQPEVEASQRLVTGTEQPSAPTTNMHIEERQADGEDTSIEQTIPNAMLNQVGRVNLGSSQNVGAIPSASISNIDITADRNLYLVPGESNARHEPRVVTGVETNEGINATSVPVLTPAAVVMSEQREVELDGENLEDQQQLTAVASRNEPPLEGAASSAELTAASLPADSPEVHHHNAKSKDHSNVSTGNDESDPHQDFHHHGDRYGGNKARKHGEVDKSEKSRRGEKQRSVDRYESEEESAEYSSDRERERRRDAYREGSVRSERDEREDRNYRDRRVRRDKRETGGERDNSAREKHNQRSSDYGSKSSRRTQRYQRYNDENEESARNKDYHSRRSGGERGDRGVDRGGDREDRGGRSDRSDRDYDDYHYQRGHQFRGSRREKPVDDRRGAYAGDETRRGNRRQDRRDRDDYDTLERRRRGEKHHPNRSGIDPREYEEYRKQSSRNARDSDLEKERTRAADPRYDARMGAMYGYPPSAYPYDPYAYYYEQMRSNPQAYADWYKKYYGQAATMTGVPHGAASASGEHLAGGSSTAATDGRESVHSGRSSAHKEKERSGNMSLRDADHIASDPQRLTPCKFTNEHAVVSLSAGILVTVKPRYTQHGTVSNIVKLHRLGANDSTRQLFQSYPGPLVRGLTHKKTIIEFCEEQIRLGPMQTTIYAKQLLSNNVEKFKPSYTLMWNLLILLLRQNGMVVGTDIAELLLKNQQQFPYQVGTTPTTHSVTSNSKSDSASPAGSELDEKLSDAEEEEDGQERETATRPVDSNAITPPKSEMDSLASAVKSSSSSPHSELEVTEKFRNYLLYGNVNEALDWATDNNLWGHALFLASKMDRRTHANVMMKFANKLSLNDPLQTLYQLMSGRTPSSVTSVQDEKWGDWRPHLSMILSNTSQKPELDRKAITTLGDSLFNRGDLYAAHFCYLMAQVGFGRYQESAALETTLQQSLPKLVLLGSSHYKQFRDFACNEAIMMTEIYEYACSLNDDKFSLVEFQPYKYLLSTRLLDYGQNLRSLMYMEQIALHIERDASKYEPSFVQKIYELADRLKYFDPALEKTMDEQHQHLEGSMNGTLPIVEEQKWLQNLRYIAEQNKIDYNTQQLADGNAMQSHIDQQFAEINKQFNELNMQYSSNVAEPTFYNPDAMQQHSLPQVPTEQQGNEQYNQEQTQALSTEYEQHHEQPQQQQQYGGYGIPTGESVVPNDVYANYAQQYGQEQQQQQQHQQHNAYYDGAQQQAQYNADEPLDANNANGVGSYDYWSLQQQQQQQQYVGDESARPTISMPKSKSYDSEDDTQRQQSSQQQQQQQKNGDSQKKQQSSKNANKDAAKSAQQSNQNSGWFGGIWNKLSLKPKNQMILPDDKNPAIVWDADKKRWVNTGDGDENQEEALKPPPKMSDMMPQPMPQQQQQHQQPLQPPQPQQQLQQHPQLQPQPQPQPQPSLLLDAQQYAAMPATASPMPAAPTIPGQSYSAHGAAVQPIGDNNEMPAKPKTPSLQSNMFKMQRNRTLKNSYVDVFNPSGAPMSSAADNVLAPAVPPVAVPQGGYFIPGAAVTAPAGNDANAYQQPPQQQQQPNGPQFYNPNQFGAGGVGY